MRTNAKWIAPAVVIAAANFNGFAWGEPAAIQPASQRPTAPAAMASVAPGAPPRAIPLRHGVFKFSSYPAAWTSAQETNRPILLFATSTNCPHCVRMVGETFKAPQVNGFINDSFETVYVSRNEHPELAAKLKIRMFPTTIVVGPNNVVLDVMEGYIEPKAFAQRLQASMAMHQASQKR